MKKYLALCLALSMPLVQATKLPPKKRLSFDSKCSVVGGVLKGGTLGGLISAGTGFGIGALSTALISLDESNGFGKVWKKEGFEVSCLLSAALGLMFVPMGSIFGGVIAYQKLFERNYNIALDCILDSEKNRIFRPFADEQALLDRIARLYINSTLPLAEAFYVVKRHHDQSIAAFTNLNKIVKTQSLSRIRKSHAKEALAELAYLLERMQNIILILKKQPDFTAQHNAKQQELMLQQQIAMVHHQQQMAQHQQQMANQAMISNFIQLTKK